MIDVWSTINKAKCSRVFNICSSCEKHTSVTPHRRPPTESNPETILSPRTLMKSGFILKQRTDIKLSLTAEFDPDEVFHAQVFQEYSR